MDPNSGSWRPLESKVAVVTGANSGIGYAVAHRLASAGASVVLLARRPKQLEDAVDRMRAVGLESIPVSCDVSDLEDVESAGVFVKETLGNLDILVNNAGVNLGGKILDLDVSKWKRCLDVNLTGAFYCSQIFGRIMVESGRGGSVVFISSQAGKRGEVAGGAYVASKFGMLGLMECLALEMAPYGIRVNAVCPGNVDTPMLRQLFSDMARASMSPEQQIAKHYLSINPMKRFANPQEVAAVCLFLVSDLASYVTGESVNVDGGELSG